MVDRPAGARTPQAGDLIMIRKAGAARDSAVGRVLIDGSHIELPYDSSIPSTTGALLRYRADQNPKGGTEISIGGLVVAEYRPLGT